MRIDPERVGELLRRFWEFMAYVCALGSMLYVAFGDNASRAFTIALAGVAFFMLSNWSHEPSDD